MDGGSVQFVLFGLAAALVSNCGSSRAWRSAVLLLTSLLFLGLLAPSAVSLLPLAGFLLIGYIGLALLQRGWARSVIWSVLTVVLAYIWLKKYTFLPPGGFLRFPYFTLGLSYIFFRVLHLLIETAESPEKWRIAPSAYLLYTLNFTTFVSGPIQRYEEFSRDQFAEKPIALAPSIIGLQLERVVRGFFKINVVAMLLHMLQEDALARLSQPLPAHVQLFAALELATVYPFFLYANFSGYIDIVIALARLMRLRLPENFNRPFAAASFLDFWTRWHITLSAWLKTYFYNPLLVALMRRVPSRSLEPFLGVFCYFVTFFLVGIWHGRTSEFVIFGVLQGGGVAVNKLWQIGLAGAMGRKGYKALASNRFYVAAGRGLTFSWFAFSLFWFWAGWKQLDQIYHAVAFTRWLGVWLTVWLVAGVSLESWERLRAAVLSLRSGEGPVLAHRYVRVIVATGLALVGFIMTVLLNQPAPSIIYKAF